MLYFRSPCSSCLFSGGRVPELDRPVARGAGQPAAVGAVGHGVDSVLVADQAAELGLQLSQEAPVLNRNVDTSRCGFVVKGGGGREQGREHYETALAESVHSDDDVKAGRGEASLHARKPRQRVSYPVERSGGEGGNCSETALGEGCSTKRAVGN